MGTHGELAALELRNSLTAHSAGTRSYEAIGETNIEVFVGREVRGCCWLGDIRIAGDFRPWPDPTYGLFKRYRTTHGVEKSFRVADGYGMGFFSLACRRRARTCAGVQGVSHLGPKLA
jgi:hypothetical protein